MVGRVNLAARRALGCLISKAKASNGRRQRSLIHSPSFTSDAPWSPGTFRPSLMPSTGSKDSYKQHTTSWSRPCYAHAVAQQTPDRTSPPPFARDVTSVIVCPAILYGLSLYTWSLYMLGHLPLMKTTVW